MPLSTRFVEGSREGLAVLTNDWNSARGIVPGLWRFDGQGAWAAVIARGGRCQRRIVHIGHALAMVHRRHLDNETSL